MLAILSGVFTNRVQLIGSSTKYGIRALDSNFPTFAHLLLQAFTRDLSNR